MGKRHQIKVNYLGSLNKVLQDLRGYATIVNELVQNADDAFVVNVHDTKSAKMIFDVTDHALIVKDGAGFKEADFERFGEFASAGKRDVEGATGAFGIGFTAVYQITDRPELRSGQRHWIMYPEDVEYEETSISFFEGTEFTLPWADDPESKVRQGLGLKAVPDDIVKIMVDEIRRAIPSAILFLKKLSDISLKHNGDLVTQVVREKEGGLILVQHGNNQLEEWHLFEGDFSQEETELRIKSQNRIEQKRRPKIELAIRDNNTIDVCGLFHAYLPTEQQIGIPLHLNADFFTSSDRKQILLNNDYQGDWNRTAIRTAARILADDALPKLPEFLTAIEFWEFLSQLAAVHTEAHQGQREETLASFWDSAKVTVMKMKSVPDSTGEWQSPSDVYLLSNKNEEQPQLPILEKLGLRIVDPKLNKHKPLLTNVGVSTFTLQHLTNALIDANLTEILPVEKSPEWIQLSGNRLMLGNEIAILIQRSEGGFAKKLANCSIACSIDYFLCPPNQLKRATRPTINIFESFSPPHYFVAPDEHHHIAKLASQFEVNDALQLLENMSAQEIFGLWRENPQKIVSIIDWFSKSSRRSELEKRQDLTSRLVKLPIWPSNNELFPLTKLFIPSEAETKPLQLTGLIDADLLKHHRSFLLDALRAKKLTSSALATILKTAGLDHALPASEIPTWFQSSELHKAFAREIKALRVDSSRIEIQKDLADCAIAYSIDGWLCPLTSIRKGSPETSKLFEQFREPSVFLGSNNQNPIVDLVDEFDVYDALDILETISQDFTILWQNSYDRLLDLIDWFETNRTELEEDDSLRERLGQLSIWPSANGLYVLEELFVPSQADKPLQMDYIFDRSLLRNHRSFLVEILNANELTSSDLANLLRNAGLDYQISPKDVPVWFRSKTFQKSLNHELETLLTGIENSVGRRIFDDCAIGYSADGYLSPLGKLRKFSSSDTNIFSQFTKPGYFLNRDAPRIIKNLVRDFSIVDAISLLTDVSAHDLQTIWQETPEQIVALIGWFEKQRNVIKNDDDLRIELCELCIWPSRDQLYPLDNLILPLNNKQPLQLQGCIDAKLVKRYYSFFSEVMKATPLSASLLASKILDSGLNNLVLREDAPEWIRSDTARSRLYHEISLLLVQEGQEEVKHLLANCAIALSVEGCFCPLCDLKEADEKTVELFSFVSPPNYFLDPNTQKEFKPLVSQFTLTDAISLIDNVPDNEMEQLWNNTPEILKSIIGWLANNRGTISESGLQDRVVALKIWPSGTALYSLDQLEVPGDFQDQLGLARFVDETIVHKYASFLTETLKARTLTLITYASELVPREIKSNQNLSAEVLRKLVDTLAQRLSTLSDHLDIRDALSLCPIVECQDGKFYEPPKVYFETETVKEILGMNALTAKISSEQPGTVREFFTWLGVEDTPRGSDIISRVKNLTSPPSYPAGESRKAIRQLFSRLGKEWEDRFAAVADELFELKTLKWLPAREDFEKWYAPDDGIYATYEMSLFETQALFLDTSDQTRKLIDFLKIPFEATADQVTRHLLVCSEQGRTIKNSYIYQNLNSKRFLNDPAIFRLKNKASIHLGKGRYARPDQVFWQNPGLGKYRHQLDKAWGEYELLLQKLGIKDHPEPQDILKVLHEISEGYDDDPQPLDDETYKIVLKCWSLLNEALVNNKISKEQLAQLHQNKLRVIPNNQKILYEPQRLFMEDRPKLAHYFPELSTYIISRKQGMWQAMKTAGVQMLSDAVNTKLLEPVEASPEEKITNLFRDKHWQRQIERVVKDWDLSLLNRLSVFKATPLRVKYLVKTSVESLETMPEIVPAFYQPDEETLYIDQNGSVPWPAISYEIAYALNPGADASQVASSFSIIFGAGTPKNASEALDMLEFPPLEDLEDVDITPRSPVQVDNDAESQQDGMEEDAKPVAEAKPAVDGNEAQAPVDKQEDPVNNNDDQSQYSTADGAAIDSKPPESTIEISNQERARAAVSNSPSTRHVDKDLNSLSKRKAGSGEGQSEHNSENKGDSYAKGASETEKSSEQTGRVGNDSKENHKLGGLSNRPVDYEPHPRSDSDNDKGPKSSRKKRKSRNQAKRRQEEPVGILTHRVVSYGDSANDSQQGDRGGNRNMQISQAGVSRVLESEKRAGRISEEMIHDQAGYDVVSRNKNGEIERYIEVKSRAGDWDGNGVTLSAHQFCFGLQKKTQFWLYIVERAEQDDFNIIKFQNPIASQQHQFIFKPL